MKASSLAFLLHAIALLSFGRAFRVHHVGLGGVGPAAAEKRTTAARIVGGPPSSSLGMSVEAPNEHERRSFLRNVAHSIVFSSAVASGSSASSAEPIGDAADLPKVTHRVFMDVRISRSDGSFYVRDANPNSNAPDESPFYGQLVLGLFGEQAPNHVEQFLKYVDVRYEVDNPLPSYSRSKFGTLDAATGLLIGGTIPGLDVTTLAGGNVLEYSGRVFPAKLWLEDKRSSDDGGTPPPKVSHDRKRLLTHRNLDPTPSFGITTRTTSTSLDATHTVFGCVLEDEGGFLDAVVDVPVLTDTGRVSRTTNEPVAAGGGHGRIAGVECVHGPAGDLSGRGEDLWGHAVGEGV